MNPSSIEPTFLVVDTNISSLSTYENVIGTAAIFGISFSSIIALVLSIIICIYVRKYIQRHIKINATVNKLVVNTNVLSPLGSKKEVCEYFAKYRHITLDEEKDEITHHLFKENHYLKRRAITEFRSTNQYLVNAVAYYKMCVLLTDPDDTIRDASYETLILVTASHPHVVTEESVEILYLTLSHLFDDSKIYAVKLLKEIYQQHPHLITAQIISKLKASIKINNDSLEFKNVVLDTLSIIHSNDLDADNSSISKPQLLTSEINDGRYSSDDNDSSDYDNMSEDDNTAKDVNKTDKNNDKLKVQELDVINDDSVNDAENNNKVMNVKQYEKIYNNDSQNHQLENLHLTNESEKSSNNKNYDDRQFVDNNDNSNNDDEDDDKEEDEGDTESDDEKNHRKNAICLPISTYSNEEFELLRDIEAKLLDIEANHEYFSKEDDYDSISFSSDEEW
jgi:hypothetical protein